MLLATTTTGIDNVHLKAEYLLMPRRVRHWQNSVMCLLGNHEHSMYLRRTAFPHCSHHTRA
jgi:hypothetical protein